LDKDVESVLGRHQHDPHALVQILREAQARRLWLPRELMADVAGGLGLTLAHVEGVATFYRFLYTRPVGEYRVLFSDNITDRMLGSESLMQDLCSRLGVQVGAVRADGRFSVDHCSCTGLCDQGPSLLINHHHIVTRLKRLHAQNRSMYDGFGAFRSNMLSLVRADGAMDLYDGVLRARDADGQIILDGADAHDYMTLIEEETRPWTYMKFPYLRSLGREQGWYHVGPLARVQNCDLIPSPLAEQRRQEFVAWGAGAPVQGVLAYHWTRMIEVLHCVEVINALLADPDIVEGELMASGVRAGGGVGVIEAPRGTLIHDYQVAENGLVTACNLIVSTTHNNQAMNEAVRSVARQYLDGRELTDGLLNRIEVAIRAFDPCLSCATHAVGQMPLDVGLQDCVGNVIDHLVKSQDGSTVRGSGVEMVRRS
jgi:NADH:ubiquinone oxidoreductase subunit E